MLISDRNYRSNTLCDRLYALEDWLDYEMQCAKDEGRTKRFLTLKRRYDRVQDYSVAVYGTRI